MSNARNQRAARADCTWVTAPRQILPGKTYFLTRRSSQRQFFLRPTPETRSIFDYCLAEAAARNGIILIAWLAMSNHYHAVANDPEGRMPAFLEHFHKLLAKSMNAHLGRRENFWSTEETCVTHLPTPADIFDKIVYVLANPVAAGIVATVSAWLGSSAWTLLGGGTVVCKRPEGAFFSKTGRMPEEAILEAAAPEAIRGSEPVDAWVKRIHAAISAKERFIADDRRERGAKLPTREELTSGSPFATPTTPATKSELRPTIACKVKAIRMQLLALQRAFRTLYQAARLRFREGERDVAFPAGTYRLRAWGARCDAYPPAA